MAVIHRFWMGDPDPTADVSGRRLLELNPEATLIDWSPTSVPGDVLELVASSAEWVVPAQWRRHAANVVRLWALGEFGGVWVDHDVTVYAPFSVMPSPATAAHHGGGRCNCWMQFPKAHPALAEALAVIAATPVAEPRASTVVSGEHLLERLWGDDVGRVRVRRDIDGRVDPDAPCWFDHAGRTARAA